MNKTCFVEQVNGGVNLKSGKLLGKLGLWGTLLSTINLSHNGVTFLWFMNFLEGKENTPEEFAVEGKKYKATRDSSGSVYIQENRDGNFTSAAGFSGEEIPIVLAELRKCCSC